LPVPGTFSAPSTCSTFALCHRPLSLGLPDDGLRERVQLPALPPLREPSAQQSWRTASVLASAIMARRLAAATTIRHTLEAALRPTLNAPTTGNPGQDVRGARLWRRHASVVQVNGERVELGHMNDIGNAATR
jgi:hypothetical protein